MSELTIFTCRRRRQKKYTREEITWADLVQRLSQTTYTEESAEEYRQMSKADQDRIKDVGGFVPGELSGGRRTSQTITSRNCVCIDLDFAPADAWDQFTLLFEWSAVMYSTHKHSKSRPRFRVIIPLSRPVGPEEYEAIARMIADIYLNLEWADDTSFQPSRMMYWPSTSCDAEYEFHELKGPILTPEEILDLYSGNPLDIANWPYSARAAARRAARPGARQQDPTTKDGPVGLFCRTYSIQEAIEKFIPETYNPTTDPQRWSYARGTTTGGLVIYDGGTLAYSNHSTDPAATGNCVNAFDLVRIHKYGSLDDDSDARGGKAPSYLAMSDFVYEDPGTQDTAYHEMFTAEDEPEEADAEPEDHSWFDGLERTKTGQVKATIENYTAILKNDPRLAGLGGLNEFTGMPEFTGDVPWRKYDPKKPHWTDADVSGLALFMEVNYGLDSEPKCKHARNRVFEDNSFHPVRDYLDGLTWDGTERLDTLLVDYLNAPDTPFTRAVTRKTMAAAVARIYEPGCKFDYVLTLKGPQGCGKSQLIRTLASEEWLNDSLVTFAGKEAYETLPGSWLVEIAELAASKRAEVEQVKQFISKQQDKYRAAYAQYTSVYKRQCVFIGTTNSETFLRDATGNRRWWIVPVDFGGRKSIFKDLPEERDQILAEAKYRYENHEELYLSGELAIEAADVQEGYSFHDAMEDRIAEFLEIDLPENWSQLSIEARRMWLDTRDLPGKEPRSRVSLVEIWCEVYGRSRDDFPRRAQFEIAEILQKLGWERARVKSGSPEIRQAGANYGRQKCFKRAVTM